MGELKNVLFQNKFIKAEKMNNNSIKKLQIFVKYLQIFIKILLKSFKIF